MISDSEIKYSLDTVKHAIKTVSPLIIKNAGKGIYTQKQDDTPVTTTDKEAEKRIMNMARKHNPNIPIFGEEGGYDALPELAWLIDPIDGTKSYITNVPAYTTMAVLMERGTAIASVIYNHSAGDLYEATKGGGAYKNGKKLDLHRCELPKRAFCRERLVSTVSDLIKSTGVNCESGPTGAGYGFSLVADGSIAARFNFPYVPGGGYIHDYAPGALLVSEAHGILISFENSQFTYKTRSFVACHPKLADSIRPLVNAIRKAEIKSV